jgi:hypothetical protein
VVSQTRELDDSSPDEEADFAEGESHTSFNPRGNNENEEENGEHDSVDDETSQDEDEEQGESCNTLSEVEENDNVTQYYEGKS